MSGLSDKDFKAAVIKGLHKVRAKTLATDRKTVSARNGRCEKKNEMEITELKKYNNQNKKLPT